MKLSLKRVLPLLLALVLVLCMVPQANAATTKDFTKSTVADLGISATDASGSGNVAGPACSWEATAGTQIEGSLVGAQGKGSGIAWRGYYYESTSTLTFTNNKNVEAELSFKYTATSRGSTYGDITIKKTEGSTTTTLATHTSSTASQQSIVETLAAGGTVTITLHVPERRQAFSMPAANGAAISITDLALTVENAVTVKFGTATNGSYVVTKADGTVVDISKNLSALTTDRYNLVATPAAGYAFAGWYYTLEDGTETFFSGVQNANDRLFDQNGTLVPRFVPVADSIWAVGDAVFGELDQALTIANQGAEKTVVLLKNHTITGSHIIPNGVTVLIPYDEAHSLSGADPITEEIPQSISTPTAHLFRKLTMASGASLTVNGALEVGAKHYASHGGKFIGGTPVTGYGQIAMEGNSEITVNGKLYAWGYITGADTASVVVNSGGQVYEKFQVTDYHGGSLTGIMLLGNNIFAFNQYYVQNVEVKEIIHSGASLICHAGIYGEGVNEMAVNFMGADGMFRLNSGHVSKRYDAQNDRLILDIQGSVSLNPITLDFDGKPYDTANFELPLNDNITINIKDGANVMINQDVMLMPGTEINVDNGGTLNLASGKKAYLVNKANWDKFCFGAELQPLRFVGSKAGAPVARSLSVAKLDINGTLELNGALYNSEAGALVVSNNKTGVIKFNAAAPTGGTSINQSLGIGGASLSEKFDIKAKAIPMTPALLTNGAGVNPATVDTAGKSAGTVYEYCADCDKWYKKNTVVTFMANDGTESNATQTLSLCSDALSANAFVAPEGKQFAGWNTVATPTEETPGVAYDDQATHLCLDDNVTLYAQWEKAGIKGDYNYDGLVDSDDLTLLARHVVAIEEFTDPVHIANADLNGDGYVDSDDLTKHARFVVGIITDWDQE